MKTIVAGSRLIRDYNLVKKAICNSKFEVSEIISGNARGVDTLAIRYAKENNIPLRVFTPNWDKYGKAAGYVINVEMAKYADALIAIWDGTSKGTNHMIQVARNRNMPIYP